MTNLEREIPGDPINFIRGCVRRRQILWTHHVNMRLRNRFIPRAAILDSVESYELIESYPDDKYLPSYLVLAEHEETTFHILFAADVPGGNVRIVTAYRPNPEEWAEDFRKRR
ncbi:MAG TPA: DUF4258 domain-containing protein [Thermoanaerobaculia bacterium]|nr:DUF4258 domain-containing protein [Thermoanaerobaculia bacterium]